MIFAKDDDEQLPFTYSDKFVMLKVLISAIFCAVGLFFVLSGQDNILGLIVLVLGALWNIFLPLNNFYSLAISIMIGIVYAIVCINIGLVANAFLYLVYYVPMQYYACHRLVCTDIVHSRVLSTKQSVLFMFYYVLFFIGVYMFSTSYTTSYLCLLDALSATMLAFSALLRNLRTADYFIIRLIALLLSILLWALISSASAFYPGALCVVIMYTMYFVYDCALHIYQKRHLKTMLKEQLTQVVSDTRQKLLAIKKQKYRNLQEDK